MIGAGSVLCYSYGGEHEHRGGATRCRERAAAGLEDRGYPHVRSPFRVKPGRSRVSSVDAVVVTSQ